MAVNLFSNPEGTAALPDTRAGDKNQDPAVPPVPVPLTLRPERIFFPPNGAWYPPPPPSPRAVALAAGSWAARAYLGLGALTPGAPADAVVYDADPRTDLTVLDRPRAVILRGRLMQP